MDDGKVLSFCHTSIVVFKTVQQEGCLFHPIGNIVSDSVAVAMYGSCDGKNPRVQDDLSDSIVYSD